jgi:hypothetical protein
MTIPLLDDGHAVPALNRPVVSTPPGGRTAGDLPA